MSTHPVEPSGGAAPRKAVTQPRLAELRARGEPIAMLTCYDASWAALLDDVGVECLLVGDSLGMVVQGHDSTLPVTLDDVAYHVRCVARGNRYAWIVAETSRARSPLPIASAYSAISSPACGATIAAPSSLPRGSVTILANPSVSLSARARSTSSRGKR